MSIIQNIVCISGLFLRFAHHNDGTEIIVNHNSPLLEGLGEVKNHSSDNCTFWQEIPAFAGMTEE